jgi:hypothetical protein
LSNLIVLYGNGQAEEIAQVGGACINNFPLYFYKRALTAVLPMEIVKVIQCTSLQFSFVLHFFAHDLKILFINMVQGMAKLTFSVKVKVTKNHDSNL